MREIFRSALTRGVEVEQPHKFRGGTCQSPGVYGLRERAQWSIPLLLYIQLYWEIGTKIVEKQAKEGWRTKVIERLAKELSSTLQLFRAACLVYLSSDVRPRSSWEII